MSTAIDFAFHIRVGLMLVQFSYTAKKIFGVTRKQEDGGNKPREETRGLRE
jgi:hypothetical protein